ncbi:uncharacterized protein Z519_00410 [Cladophialophora bantiana CBS 173.52]|uniref:Cytochrome P450 n=1 Tax=Cladophialophora bantiana (strain ATCC 10958 / CBS 173.52 / CDC B-1940 / NIH 8579) TaxID=1442370 RepID=A0A0D2GK15_CLAB1|nr:uncharacterized protein Z519_00410 [Cladophialophora bantiana CBS 173.52]KIW98747.1 hypothetical protein Z519_00410 [Cladophialophora bantiana CBS 173.52]
MGPGTVVVLTDRRIIKQLLDKKASTSSNRPVSLVTQNLITEGDHMLMMDNTPRWRLMRKLIHQDLTESLCDREHSKLHQAESVQLLYDMLHNPDDWVFHLKRYSNSIIMCIVYGIRTPSIEAPWTQKLNEIVELWARINEFGATPPVDLFPFLKWIPERFLGNWLTRSKVVHDEVHSLYGGLLKAVETRRAMTGSVYCIADRILDQSEKSGLTNHNVMLLAGVTLKGGSDTTASTLASFVQAMLAFPEVQKKAQAEIDAVVGETRIPVWSDYDSMPYVAAVVKETMRWRPTAPLGFPHALSEDEWVDGKLLPKGTVVFVNVWGLHHDETKFPDSDTFDPDHYKGRIALSSEYANSADYENRDHYGFGNGRRLCPGIHLADRNLWHAISKLLWAFNFEKKIDPQTGKLVALDTTVETGYREGLTMCPYEFPCKTTIRSETRRQVILKDLKEAQTNFFPQYEKVDLFMPKKQ